MKTTTLISTRFGGMQIVEDGVAILRAEFIESPQADQQASISPLARQFLHWLEGHEDMPPPIELQGTPFQQKVWRAAMAIPRGETRTYGQLACEIGNPAASRAVGRALGDNPIAVIIPCHRVISASGALTGFRWGLDRKQALLDFEQSQMVS
jgi:O-6-methylguanine DNA methyltransferase